MTRGVIFELPDDAWLSTFLGVTPRKASPQDGFWCFELGDTAGQTLELSIWQFERAVEVVIRQSGRELTTIRQEGALRLKTESRPGGKWIECEFEWDGARSKMALQVGPVLLVRLNTLVQ